MNKFLFHNLLIILLAVLGTALSLSIGKLELVAVFTLLMALFSKEHKAVNYKDYIFITGLFTSLMLFSYSPVIALLVFEIVRLINKGLKDLNESIFSFVPLATLIFSSFEASASDPSHFVYYFASSLLLIFIDSFRREKNWSSLMMISYFIVGSNLVISRNITLWIVLIYICYLVLSQLSRKQDNFFNSIGLTTFGLISVSFTSERIFSYLLISLAFESLYKERKIKTETLVLIYIFTLFLFSRDYFREINSIESLFPIILILFPLLFIKGIITIKRDELSVKSANFKALLAISTYILGVFVYAN